MKAKASTPAKLKEYGKDGEELPSWHAKLQAQPKRSWILKMQKLQKAPKGSVGVLLVAKPKTGLLRSQIRATGPRGQLASADELKTGGAEAIAEPEAKARPKTRGAEAIAEPEPKGKAKGKGKGVIAYSLGKVVQKLTADEECVEEELLRLQMIWKDRNDSTKPENREPWTRSPRGQVTERLAAERLAAQCKAQGLEARAQARAAWQNQGSAAASSSSAGPMFENIVLRKYLVKVVKSQSDIFSKSCKVLK